MRCADYSMNVKRSICTSSYCFFACWTIASQDSNLRISIYRLPVLNSRRNSPDFNESGASETFG